jgi:hypothetical protein
LTPPISIDRNCLFRRMFGPRLFIPS